MNQKSAEVNTVSSGLTTTVPVEEIQKTLGLSKDSVYQGFRNKQIPAKRIGSRWVVTRQMWDRFLEGELAAS